MPQTEEEKKIANRISNKKFRESEKYKQYIQSPEKIKSLKISAWKQLGLVVTSEEEMDEIYARYLASERCEKKGCEYTETNWKCMDHIHLNGKYGYFRNIICNSCNVNDKVSNTSGVPNVSKHGNGWAYERTINGNRHFKWFKTFEEACAYKIEFEENN